MNMIFGSFTVILCLTPVWQNIVVNAKIYIEDINILYANSDYFDVDTLDVSINYKPNGGNTINAYLDILKNLEEDVTIHIDPLSRVMGYEIPLGLSMTTKMCDPVGKRIFDIVCKPLGINDCPAKKGTYSIEDFEPDMSKASYIIPGGYLSLDIEIYTEIEKLLHLKLFIVG